MENDVLNRSVYYVYEWAYYWNEMKNQQKKIIQN